MPDIRPHGKHGNLFARLLVPLLAGTFLVGCGTSSPQGVATTTSQASAAASTGGVATLAEAPGTVPNYIFPFIDGAENTVVNLTNLQYLIFRPLLWFGNGSSAVGLNTSESLAYPPTYSSGYRTVTIHLKPFQWSDGTAVSSRDLTFWLNLLKANKAHWASYLPGQFPDNVASFDAPNSTTLVLHLTRPYNPQWFTNNELSQLYPIPQQAWDRTSATGPVGNYDTSPAGACSVYAFLNSQSMDLSTYNTNPLWKVVDGPWQLQHFDAEGNLTFVPNPHYSGPVKAHLSKFQELPFTSTASEYNYLLAGQPKLSVGYLPEHDLPAQGQVSRAGYSLHPSASFSINFIEVNFNNPTVGPLVKQLYIRQALQHLMDQPGQIKSLLRGVGGYADYGPIPPEPANPYVTSTQLADPYPFSISTARSLLTSHGWAIPATGPAVCTRPGTAASDCGAGIASGKKLEFNLLYTSGSNYLSEEMANYQGDAASAGIVLQLKTEAFNTVIGAVNQCTPSQATCSWQLATWGAGAAWLFGNDPYPSGEPLFTLGSNTGSWVDATAEHLIQATNYSPSPASMHLYDNYVSQQVPVIFQLCTYALNEVASNLRGVTFGATGNLTPENWYFVK